jgi:hypothetical protein
MPRKRRTPSPDKPAKLWIAPEWSARVHESRAATALSSGFSRYLALADKVLAADAKSTLPKSEADSHREKLVGAAPLPMQQQIEPSEHRALPPEALLAFAAPRAILPKPPKRPAYPKLPKLAIPRRPPTPKPRKVIYPKPPNVPR